MSENERNLGQRLTSHWVDIVLILMLAISLSGNVMLGWEVRSLRAGRSPVEARVGMSISELNVRALSGQDVSLSLVAQQPTVLYIFKPSCHWCVANIENIRSLSRQHSADIRFIGIATTNEGLAAYIQQYPLPFSIYVIADPAKLSGFNFIGTPQTIELSPQGTVLHNWVGAYNPEIANAIQRQFSVHLPGLIEAKNE